MSITTLRTLVLGAASAALAGLLVAPVSASASSPWLDQVRDATRQDKSVHHAKKDGYAKFVDAKGIACIDMPGMGAMGIHYVNGTKVGRPNIVPTKPEAVLYAPDRHGRLHLAAVEYVVVKADWDATHKAPPRLFGHTFNFTDAPNRFGLPPFYSLHVWAFKHNPAGKFEMWNPNVHCDCGMSM